MHPNYQIIVFQAAYMISCTTFLLADTAFHDIALMKVRGQIKIDGTYVAIANLPRAENTNNIPEVDSVNFVVGFGCTSTGGEMASRAQLLGLKTNTKEECAYAYSIPFVDHLTHFCAGYFHENRDLCLGDSGSGLISFQHGQPMIVGVFSVLITNDTSNFPGKFMRVAAYVPWIRQYIG
ncbi:hypothetical protein EG68_05622 [Paragonimus skrjabini miyazakii]|uniref:Peptidase S1 domain-containing protein n=1 Tax=Paragonimus skrjabini miyazakii TaxID=59628 RepID=A0A8S9YVA2_9TREM|nr:hypothetical protein EG68_05622 [Paragonimus skrjabini miyazakii]